MSSRAIVKNDVYGRHNIELIDFHPPITPSAHSDEMELFCAKQSLAVYATYPSLPHDPEHDYIPSLKSDAFAKGMVSLTEIIQTAGLATIPTDGTSQPEDDDPSAYGNSGYRSFVSDKAAALLVWKGTLLSRSEARQTGKIGFTILQVRAYLKTQLTSRTAMIFTKDLLDSPRISFLPWRS